MHHISKTWISVAIIFLLSGPAAFAAAAGGSSSGPPGNFLGLKASDFWFVGGGGTLTSSEPLHSNISFSAQAGVFTGVDFPLYGAFYLSTALGEKWATGKMKYDYTDKDKAHFTAENVGVSRSATILDLGLQIRLINAGNLHVFVEGGGSLQSWNLAYDFLAATNESTGGIAAQASQDGVSAFGSYAKVGVDLLAYHGWGLRAYGRAGKGTTIKIDALGAKNLNFVEGEAYGGIIGKF